MPYHKYIDRKWSNGRWNYTYDEPKNNRSAAVGTGVANTKSSGNVASAVASTASSFASTAANNMQMAQIESQLYTRDTNLVGKPPYSERAEYFRGDYRNTMQKLYAGKDDKELEAQGKVCEKLLEDVLDCYEELEKFQAQIEYDKKHGYASKLANDVRTMYIYRKDCQSAIVALGAEFDKLNKMSIEKTYTKHSAIYDGGNYLIHWAKGKESKNHKWIKRDWGNGRWNYTYKTPQNNRNTKISGLKKDYSSTRESMREQYVQQAAAMKEKYDKETAVMKTKHRINSTIMDVNSIINRSAIKTFYKNDFLVSSGKIAIAGLARIFMGPIATYAALGYGIYKGIKSSKK